MQDEGIASKSMMLVGVMMLGRNDDEVVEVETGRLDDDEENKEDE